jgi:uncharacterized protein YggE
MIFKHKVLQVVLFGMLVLTIAGCAAAPSVNAQAANNPLTVQSGGGSAGTSALVQTTSSSGSQGITVVGTGKATGAPDQAQVTVGVQTSGTSVQQAVNDNQAKMNALIDALKALGIASNDLRTSNYNVSANQPPVPAGIKDGTPTSETYQVSNQVTVIVRDISKLASVLDKAVASGANSIYGVDFSISDTSNLQADAESNAVQDAKKRAENLAKLEGVTLGSIVSVSESSSGFPGPITANAFGIGGGGTPIQPGQLDVTVSLQVTYSIK